MRIAIAMLVLLAALPAQAAETVEVHIDNFTFTPATITVSKGTTVTWVNHDDMVHSVVAGDAGFRSQPLDTDQSFAHTFAQAGDFTYFCGLHPQMTGRVVVKP